MAHVQQEKARIQGEKAARNMFAMKLKGMLGACFVAWRDDVRSTKRITLRLRIIFGKINNAAVAAAWTTWVRAVGNHNRNLLGEVMGSRERAEVRAEMTRLRPYVTSHAANSAAVF